MLHKTLPSLNGSPRRGSATAKGKARPIDTSSDREVDRRTSMDSHVCKCQPFLDGLPDDILRVITEYCKESLRPLRLVSRRWCLFIDDFTKQNVPQIDQLNVSIDKLKMKIYFTIKKSHAIFYQRTLQAFQSDKYTNHVYLSGAAMLHLELYHHHHLPNHTKHFPDMSGLRFLRVSIRHPESKKDSSKVEEMLKLWNFESLSVEYTQLTNINSEFIVSILAKKDTKHLSIRVEKCRLRDPQSFFLRLSDVIESLHIEHNNNWYKECESKHLCGVENHAWADLIREMFTRKLHWLTIRNDAHAHLGQDELDKIQEIVASSGDGRTPKNFFSYRTECTNI